MLKFYIFLSLCTAFYARASQVERLLEKYGEIQSVTCHIRRTVVGPAGNIRFISRVYWKNNDCLHVENLSPVSRRIIADGTTFFSYAEGDPKGFSRPIEKLSNEMLISLHRIPGTAMDHLLRLKDIPEHPLSDNRFAYDTEKNHIVITLDNMDRLVKIDFFSTSGHAEKTGTYEYSGFSEVLPGVWVSFNQKATLCMGDQSEINETVKLDRFIVNEPIAQSLFSASSFFDKAIDFTDSFSDIYNSNVQP